MGFIDNGDGPGMARRLIVPPIEAIIGQQAFSLYRLRLELVAMYQGKIPALGTHQGGGIGIEQGQARIEAITLPRRSRSFHPPCVQTAGT